MNWVLFWVLFGYFFLNLCGLGIYHYAHKKEQPLDGSKEAKIEFGIYTGLMLFIGITYLLIIPFKLFKR